MQRSWLWLANLLTVCSLVLASPSGMPRMTRTTGSEEANGQQKPHIIIILADDLGWNDVSFHGSNEIPTPNIDALAYNGVILNSHYVPALCTPSRSALMTGKYPFHNGMQHSVLLEGEPRGLPLQEKLLPEYLREAGYKTHAVGKWHLGYHRVDYTPTRRGFDSHFGYWNGLQDYWSHEVQTTYGTWRGFDMRRNLTVAWDTAGKYSTDLFTDEAVNLIENHNSDDPMFLYMAHLAPHTGLQDAPFQAPDEEIAKFTHIADPERRIYAAMVSKLDHSVGEVMAALRRRNMLENSIVLFMTDNGAPTLGIHSNRGSNYPMRGIKATAWEGGVRGVAAIWSPLIEKSNRVSNQLMYMTDWLPTLYAAAGLNVNDLGSIDGVNMWPALRNNKTSPRSDLVVNIDDIFNYAAIRKGDFKYVIGTVGRGDDWYGENGRPGLARNDRTLPNYDPSSILESRAGVALAGVITARQVAELKKVRNGQTDAPQITTRLVTAADVQSLRNDALLECNVKEEDKVPCNALESPCLFNLKDDPCELVNLAKTRPLILATLEEALMKYRLTAIPATNVDADPRANPVHWNNTWVNWDELHPMKLISEGDPASPKKLSGPAIAVIAVILALSVVAILTLFGFRKCQKNNPPADNHPELGALKGVPESIGEANDCTIEEPQSSELSRSLHSLKELSSLKDLSKNID
ncbi:arylsulfatase B-like [Athalia rosae]|uniref:arylsulfatase B-like n=1 Tax=Athalia rosae TaxID=37344 RepID=UPI0020348E7D|nr:arylsulfatase B-like [Athalia rosae]XP_020711032.2 arylsulfatase B-like [Athalia rosae]